MKTLAFATALLSLSTNAALADSQPCTVHLVQNGFQGVTVNLIVIQNEVSKDLQKIGCELVSDIAAKYELRVDIDGMDSDGQPKLRISDYAATAKFYFSEAAGLDGSAVALYQLLDGANLNGTPIANHGRNFAYTTETVEGAEREIMSNAMWAAKAGVKQIKIAEANEAK
jgi:hypothetical protein